MRFLPLLIPLLTACQAFPILNHAPAPDERYSADSPSSSEDCPLDFDSEGLCGELAWISPPTDQVGGVLSLKFWSQAEGSRSGPYIAPRGQVSVFLWMPEHGHGSSPVQVTGDGGEYEVSEVYFIMPGNWDIHVQIKSGGSVLDESTLRYVAQ